MSRKSRFRFPFWKKAAQRSFRNLLRPLVLERLENRQLFDATNWTNPLQRLDVSGDVSQSVDPLDALIIINEINAPFYTSPNDTRLPDLPDSNRNPHPYLDVDCDGFVSPLDVLNIVNAINQQSFPTGWDFDSNSNSIDGGFVSSASCGPKIHEGSSYVTQISTDVLIPPNATNLSFRISSTFFDTFSAGGMKDAFEAAFVDQKGQTLVFPYVRSRDSFLNMSEGQVVASAPGVNVSGDRVQVNVSQIPAGTVGKLIVRLVNNDHDSRTSAAVNDLNVATVGTPVPISSTASPTTPSANSDSAIDFSHFTDVTGSLVAQYGRTSHNEDPQILYTDLSILNSGTYEAKAPMLLVLKNFSDPSIRVRNADGLTPEGFPYFDYSALVTGGTLAPGGISGSRIVSFYNPNQTQFAYDIDVLGQLNRAPTFTSEPDVEALTGKTYTYTALATDPDADKLKYSILIGPVGMTIDSASGVVIWNPTSNDVGNQSVTLRVDDGHGAHADQRFTLAVIATPPNRPPVFTSTPVVSANVNTPYTYDANARDEDGDALSYSLVAGAEGMSVDKATGAVSWIPNASLGTAQEKSYTSIDLSPFANLKLSDLENTTPNYPTGSFQPFGVPFFIPQSGQNIWHSVVASGTNPRVLEIPVSVTGATAVHTLINTYWGQGGPASYAYAEFFGAGGAYFRKDLIGNEDIRDYFQNTYTNRINGSTSRAAFSEGSVRLDEQRIALPPAFLGQTLERIRLVDNGGDGFQRIFVSGVTVESSVDVMAKRPVSIAVEDGRGGSATQNFVIDIQPTLGNNDPAIVTTPNVSKIDLIRNGSFELTTPNDVVTGCNGCQAYIAGIHNNSIANWTLEGTGEVYIHKSPEIGNAVGSTFNSARTGNQYLDLSGGIGGGSSGLHATISQTFATIPSTKYELRFFIGAAFAPVASINVRVDGASSIVNETFTANAPSSNINWTEKVITFVANSTTTKLSFRDTTGNDDNVSFVDDVSVTVEASVAYVNSQKFSYDLHALDADNDALTYSLDAGPQGMTIDSQTGNLTWSPVDADVGEHLVLVRVEDGRGGSDVQRFVVHAQMSSGTPAEIRGTKFHDLNGDGVFNRTVNVNVPGFSNPWLAGMPAGSNSSRGDVAPAQSPVNVPGLSLVAGSSITFSASGSVSNDPSPSGTLPDGYFKFYSHADGDWNGISNVVAPVNSLVALFLGPNQPSQTQPPATLDFSSTGNVVGGIDYEILSPQLQQVFFVGDGITSMGVQQRIIVPEGATRLFLGTMDSFGWFNNSGTFNVAVTAFETEPGLRGWTIYLDQNTNGQRDSNELSKVTDSKGEYAFTNLAPGTYVVAEEPFPTYDAVRDFTVAANPNSPWTYGYSQTRGSTFQQSTITGVVPNLDYWSATSGGPFIIHNLTGSAIPGGITYPADALNLDPSFDGRNSVLRFTAPVTDTYHITGRFQGINLATGTTTDVAILHNSQSILSGDINGFYRDIATTPGAIKSFDLQMTVQQGDTLDFSVGQGTGGSLSDSTGVSAIIVGSNWRQTSPSTKTHTILVGNGEVRNQVDFGNVEQASVPTTNRAPQITSTAVTESGVGARYRATATATDADGDRLTFDLPVKPSGMTVDPSTGIIVWTPTADQAGVQNVILRVSDGRGGVDLQSFQVTVASRNSGPTITSRPLGPAQANLPYQYRIRAQDAEGDTIEYSLNTPAIGNMTVDSVTGVFSWLPSSSDIGSHTIEVTATDSSGDGQLQKFTLEVLASAPNREPQILSTPRDQVRLGSSYMHAIDAIDPDGDPLAYRLDVSPSGMTIDSNGLIIWTPTEAQFGNNPVQVSVSDGRGGVRVQAFTIAVLSKAENHAPVINSTPTLAATLDVRYRYDVKANDEDGDTLAFSLDTKPTGMSIDALTGAIRWIPTADQLGTQPIVVRVTDTQGSSVTQSLTVTVRGSNLAPEISSVPKTIAAVGRAYSYVLKATDPEGGPLTYSLSKKSGNMIIDSSGTIQWVPGAGEVGNVNVTVRVSDDQGVSVEQSFTVVVAAAAPNSPPIITSQPNLGATVGQRYQYQVTATDPDGGPVRFAFLEVPNGMTIDESTGLIQWTSDAAGIGRVTVLVGDFDGGEAEQSFEVTVRSTNVAPQIASTPVVNTAAGVTYNYDVRASDANLDPLTFALVTAPVGMTMDNLGRITWTTAIADAGTHRVKFTVSDDLGASVAQEYDLVVTADTDAPKVRIQVDSNPVGLSETLVIQVNASDNTGVKTLDVTVDGKAISLDERGRASVLMTQVGSVRIAAVATDAAGNTGRQTMDVKVVDTSVTGSPTVDVTIPAENATITAPTDVIGTVQDPNLVSWKLEVAPFDGGEFKQIATGTNQIANGKIATFDPTMLQNDSYILRLTALNTGGLSSSIDTVVNVTGNLKLGNFTLSFTDLAIQVAGIPITVSRTYDTLTANQNGEIGYGWRLSFRDVDLRTNLQKTGDEAGGIYTPFRDGTRVYVTLPGGQREGFTFRPKAVALFDQFQRERDVPPEYQPGNGLNAAYFVPSFVADKGVTNQLKAPRFQLTKRGNEYFQFGGGLPYNPADSSFGGKFQLVSRDGLSYAIDATSGLISRVSDLGNQLVSFDDDGVSAPDGRKIVFASDANGRVVSITDLDGKKVQYNFNAVGDLESVADRLGQKTTFEYDSSRVHYLVKINDPLGRTGLRTEFDAEGRLKKVTNGIGSTSGITYDPIRMTQTITNPRGFTISQQFDADGNVIAETNPLGHTTTTAFDSFGNVTRSTDPLGHTTFATFDTDGNLLSEKDALGNDRYYAYDKISVAGIEDVFVRSSETDALGNAIHFRYDNHGRLLSTRDSMGNELTAVYDERGRLISTDDGHGRKMQQSYDTLGNLTQVVDPSGRSIQYGYSPNGLPVRESTTRTKSDGSSAVITSTLTIDAEERPTGMVGPVGLVVSVAYDPLGNTSTLTNSAGAGIKVNTDASGQKSGLEYPDGSSNVIVRDANGNIISNTDRLGRRTEAEFNAADQLVRVRNPDGSTETRQYDIAGRLTSTVNSNGARTSYEYDANNRLIAQIDPLGNRTSTTYDANGQVESEVDANGNVTRFAYDSNGNLTRTIYADGNSEEYKFDIAANRGTLTAEDGSKTTLEYDARGQITAVVDAVGNKTSYVYDERGQMISQTSVNGQTTRWEFDDLGALVGTTLPMGAKEINTIGTNKRVSSIKDFNGTSTDYVYDAMNRLVEIRSLGELLIKNSYSIDGWLTDIQSSQGIEQLEYDTRGRIVRSSKPDGTFIKYEYDGVGNRLSTTTPFGKTTYAYDSANRLISVTDDSGARTQYKYDANGNVVESIFPNAVKETRVYDNRNRLTTLRHIDSSGHEIASYLYTLDTMGRRIEIVEGSGRRVNNTYDVLGRLVREEIKDPTIGNSVTTYTYDKTGNRLTRDSGPSGLTSYEYDANDRLIRETTGATVISYRYDANGNEIDKSINGTLVQKNTWNVLDQLVHVELISESSTTNVAFEYDHQGIRTSETRNGVQTRFLVDETLPISQVLAEYNTASNATVTYVIGIDRILQQTPQSKVYFLKDGAGSTRALVDSDGKIKENYAYDAFGKIVTTAPIVSTSYLFAGEHFDEDLESYYLRARRYSPDTGRFSSQDPISPDIANPQTLNRYLYATNDPVNFSDPSGLESLVTQLQTLGIQQTVRGIASGITKDALLKGGGLLQGASTLAAFFSTSRTRDPFKATALVQGFGGNVDNAISGRLGVGVAIDQFIQVKNRIPVFGQSFPTVLTFQASTSLSDSASPSRAGRRIRNPADKWALLSFDVHGGFVWNQKFPLGSVDFASAVSWNENKFFKQTGFSGSLTNGVSVNLPGNVGAEYGFTQSVSGGFKQLNQFLSKAKAPVRLAVPKGLASQISIGFYVNDLMSFEKTVFGAGAAAFDDFWSLF